MDEKDIISRIHALVEEEDRLREAGERIDEDDRARIDDIEVALDQCWDLLRQRRARREFGEDPDAVAPRDEETVEGYIQ